MEGGAILRRHVVGIEDVLDGDGNAMQRSRPPPFLVREIGGLGLLQRVAGVVELPCLDGSIDLGDPRIARSEEHTSELQSLMRISYAVFCLKKKTQIYATQCKDHRHQGHYNQTRY